MFRFAQTPLTLVTLTPTLEKRDTDMGITFKKQTNKQNTSMRKYTKIHLEQQESGM